YRSDGLLADVPVLAEDAAEIAQAEEDRARAAPATEAVLLAEVWKGAGNPGVAPRVPEAAQAGHWIAGPVARTAAAILQFPQAGGDSLAQLTGAIERQVCRLERVQQEAGIDSLHGSNTDHAATLLLIDLLYLAQDDCHTRLSMVVTDRGSAPPRSGWPTSWPC